MRKNSSTRAPLLPVATIWLALVPTGSQAQMGASTAPGPFTVTSPTLVDGAFISTQNAASANGCGGQNISPQMQWANAPMGTRSFALLMFDPDGNKGLGVTHWIAYDVPSTTAALAEGAGGTQSSAFVGGVNTVGTALYSGPCPPVGDQPHHYAIGIYALDLAPGTLKPGLDRDGFLQAVRGHSLAEASLVVRYVR